MTVVTFVMCVLRQGLAGLKTLWPQFPKRWNSRHSADPSVKAKFSIL